MHRRPPPLAEPRSPPRHPACAALKNLVVTNTMGGERKDKYTAVWNHANTECASVLQGAMMEGPMCLHACNLRSWCVQDVFRTTFPVSDRMIPPRLEC